MRTENSACYHQGKVQYELLAQEPAFAQGLMRIRQGMEHYRIALMCAEKDPIECHRGILVARYLLEYDVIIYHIHADGTLEKHSAMESRLLDFCKLPAGDMFNSRAQFIAQAYKIQGERIAYQDETLGKTGIVA